MGPYVAYLTPYPCPRHLSHELVRQSRRSRGLPATQRAAEVHRRPAAARSLSTLARRRRIDCRAHGINGEGCAQRAGRRTLAFSPGTGSCHQRNPRARTDRRSRPLRRGSDRPDRAYPAKQRACAFAHERARRVACAIACEGESAIRRPCPDPVTNALAIDGPDPESAHDHCRWDETAGAVGPASSAAAPPSRS